MLKEFVDAIGDLHRSATSFQSLTLPGGRQMLIRQADGQVIREPVPPDTVRYEAGDLDSFVALVTDADDGVTRSPLVFVQMRHPVVLVTALLDKADRRDRVVMEIGMSRPRAALMDLASWHKQKEVCERIRDQLFDGVEADLLPKLRAMEFSRRNDGGRTVEHGRESLGRSVETSVQSSRGELPEFTTVRVPWFANEEFAGIAHTIPVTIDLDATNEMIRFVPRGDVMQHASELALRSVREHVEGTLTAVTDVPVVIGTPDG